jgi:cytochrome oxidase Cu insertion factor (SCO1/SenC/PrrC family)/cytochrome c2
MNLRSLLFASLAATAFACGDGADAPDKAAARKGYGDGVWGASYFPNIELTEHSGKKVRFFDDLIEGKVVMINFMFTSCPDVCPMETARLLDVQRLLGERVGTEVHMYSISIDPTRDTPEVLAAYRERWGVQPGWSFYTGKLEEIDLLRQKLGVLAPELDPEMGAMDHNINMVLGNQATGRWMRRSPFENPYGLANDLGTWLTNWKKRSPETLVDQGDKGAPTIRTPSAGEVLFRTRCASCHTLGGVDTWGITTGKRVGPDLYGVVANRDAAWLRRWLAEPDKMLAEKDPLAMSLLAASNGIAMPNAHLTPVDIDNVIAYLSEASAEIDKERAASPATPPR